MNLCLLLITYYRCSCIRPSDQSRRTRNSQTIKTLRRLGGGGYWAGERTIVRPLTTQDNKPIFQATSRIQTHDSRPRGHSDRRFGHPCSKCHSHVVLKRKPDTNLNVPSKTTAVCRLTLTYIKLFNNHVSPARIRWEDDD